MDRATFTTKKRTTDHRNATGRHRVRDRGSGPRSPPRRGRHVTENLWSGVRRQGSVRWGARRLIALLSIGALMTMHLYVKPRPIRHGFRLFGFRMTRD